MLAYSHILLLDDQECILQGASSIVYKRSSSDLVFNIEVFIIEVSFN